MGDSDPPSSATAPAPTPPGQERTSLRQAGELGLIRLVRGMAGGEPAPGVLTGIGDDTAVLALTPGANLLATTDLLIEDVHFRRAWASPGDIGWKALAVNLSDVAAMGGIPRFALVALALPGHATLEEAAEFFQGLAALAHAHRVALVGGDTSSSPDGWMVNVTVLGEHSGRPRLRAHARPGHLVAVTGSLGRAAAGLRLLEGHRPAAGLPADAEAELVAAHLRPMPRVAEGQWLGAAAGVQAMMDLSDGLATDLGHICAESGVGADVWIDRLPIAAATRAAGVAVGGDPVRWAAGGGEDYELLVTLDAAAGPAVARDLEAATGTALTVVGRIRGGREVAFLDARGQSAAMGPGYEHFRD